MQLRRDRTYSGKIGHDGKPIVNYERKDKNGVMRVRTLAQYVVHSPEGFGWGHAGNSAQDLAIAILANATSDPYLARVLDWQFAREHVARLPKRGEWSLHGTIVADWLAEHATEDARAEARRLRRLGYEGAGIREVRH